MLLWQLSHRAAGQWQDAEIEGEVDSPDIRLSDQARRALRRLSAETRESPRCLPRLAEQEVIALTIAEPESDDVIIQEGGVPFLAISRNVLDSLPEGERLEVVESETGEPAFKLIAPPEADSWPTSQWTTADSEGE